MTRAESRQSQCSRVGSRKKGEPARKLKSTLPPVQGCSAPWLGLGPISNSWMAVLQENIFQTTGQVHSWEAWKKHCAEMRQDHMFCIFLSSFMLLGIFA